MISILGRDDCYGLYNSAICYEKPQIKMRDFNDQLILTEKNDQDNDLYRNARAKATQIADVDRYSSGVFDLSLLVAGRNENSFFSGKIQNEEDVDYFHVNTSSQILSRRPVHVRMEMPEGCDFDLVVYDENGNQVGIATANGDGSKSVAIPCDWSSSRDFVIRISQRGDSGDSDGEYKLTFSQGEMPQEVVEWVKKMGTSELIETTPEERKALAQKLKVEREKRNEEGLKKLHEEQLSTLPEERYFEIFRNINEIYEEDNIRAKEALEKDFSQFLKSAGLEDREFGIHLTEAKTAEVIGLEEEEKKIIQDYVESNWNQFKNVYLSNSSEAAEMSDYEYRLASYVEELNLFLGNMSMGTISVEDLSFEKISTGKISYRMKIAGLPASIDKLINQADSTNKYYDYKQMINDVLSYRQVHEEIPEFHINFSWNGNLGL